MASAEVQYTQEVWVELKFTFLYGFFKLECLKIKHRLNHFALRAKLLIRATQIAYAELAKLQAA